MSSRTILVTGATGKQGRSVINALLASPIPVDILALTRSASSASAQALVKRGVRIVEGSFDAPEDVFKKAGPIDSLFLMSLMQTKKEGAEIEGRQGKAMVAAAARAGVSHLVFTSVNRNGEQLTNVPHFRSKGLIEQSIREHSERSGGKMAWTFLRPVAFMENFVPGFQGKVFGSIWRHALGANKKLQLVAVKDIGEIAAIALLAPDKYASQALELAGDDLTFKEADRAFREAAGIPVPVTSNFFGWLVLRLIKEMDLMFKFFRDEGYSADISKLRAIHPQLRDLKAWIRESDYVKKSK